MYPKLQTRKDTTRQNIRALSSKSDMRKKVSRRLLFVSAFIFFYFILFFDSFHSPLASLFPLLPRIERTNLFSCYQEKSKEREKKREEEGKEGGGK